MVLIVELGDSLPKGSDAGRGAVLAAGHGDVDGLGTLEAAGDVVLDLGRALAQVGPGVRVLEEAVLGGALGAPDDAGGGSAGVETGMGHVALVGVAELAVNLGLELCNFKHHTVSLWKSIAKPRQHIKAPFSEREKCETGTALGDVSWWPKVA